MKSHQNMGEEFC